MPTIETQMTEIQEMDLPALRDAWRRHYRVPPPRRLSRDLLMRGIAYKLQEQVHGGLSKAARRRLRTLAKAFSETGRIATENGTKVRPGARLVREWQGRTHVVTATEGGFNFDGKLIEKYAPEKLEKHVLEETRPDLSALTDEDLRGLRALIRRRGDSMMDMERHPPSW